MPRYKAHSSDGTVQKNRHYQTSLAVHGASPGMGRSRLKSAALASERGIGSIMRADSNSET
ncbi:Hypothetical protein GbCGDNIH3_5083 [Granulibacter bethesdensis]|uniref:Uncharacterized protein n=1 Tax=Granulibacter bethesdensis TaxID=364410 RepID=A0AAN0VG10_9PROT|nr:Hypothetical protein GbCGDNIH3_5083 [Granulibacter bethesdensis]APH59636.1 Hypothetical protein GbCGDNIH7_5083 [Granulibacter bethesdensis]